LLGIRVIQCRPRDPEAEGLVERANGYLETSFLPGRSFTPRGDFNAQLEAWLPKANVRKHRSLDCRPTDRVDTDRASMLPLAPVAPAMGWRATVRVPRDHYVRLDGNDYSVHPSVIGRRVDVSASPDTVTVHQTISDRAATLGQRRRHLRGGEHGPLRAGGRSTSCGRTRGSGCVAQTTPRKVPARGHREMERIPRIARWTPLAMPREPFPRPGEYGDLWSMPCRAVP
jgi:hypothetical protein